MESVNFNVNSISKGEASEHIAIVGKLLRYKGSKLENNQLRVVPVTLLYVLYITTPQG